MRKITISPCTQWVRQLAARNEHDLTIEEHIALRRHLAICASCAAAYTAYEEMEMRIRALPPVKPLARFSFTEVEDNGQTIASHQKMPPWSLSRPPRPENAGTMPKHMPARASRRAFPRALDMGFALAFVAAIVLVSLLVFQKNHTSTSGVTPQNLYQQVTGGKPMLQESMSSPTTENWDESLCQFNAGAYHAKIQQSHSATICLDQSSTFNNFAYQVRMTVNSGDGGGIVFRSDNTYSRMYEFGLYTDGSYIFSLSSGTCTILAHGSSPAINTAFRQVNVLTVIAQHNTIFLYINGRFLVQVHDSTISSGMIGVFAADVSNPADVAFTAVKVWKL